jgi:hypothetical protein
MINKILLTENRILKGLRMINEQDSEEYYKISPEEYQELMEFASYNGNAVTKLKKFGGKPLWITGYVSLRNTPTVSLGNVARIEGGLDISKTKIKSLGNTVVDGHVSYYDTPMHSIEIQKEYDRKREEMSDDRENGTRDLNYEGIDDDDIKANALFKWLVENGRIEGLDKDSVEEKKKIEDELLDLNSKLEDNDDMVEYTELYDKISELEERLEEINSAIDVYDIYKHTYTHYGLTNFEVLNGEFHGEEYTVGTDSEMDEACQEYTENLIDDVGLDGFRPGYIDSYIDEGELRDYVEQYYESDIWDNPEVYFNDDDFELTEKQVKRKEELEKYIETLEELKSETEDEQNELENEIEDSDEYSQKWDELQAKIDEIEGIMEETQEEIDGIEPDTDTPTQDMVDEVLNERVKDALYDPADWIKEHGLDIKDFIDKEELAKGVAEDDGWGVMNSYNGDYDDVSVNNVTYYIMRIN